MRVGGGRGKGREGKVELPKAEGEERRKRAVKMDGMRD